MLHGAALPKRGKAPPGKLMVFFPLDRTPSASSHWRPEKGSTHPKEAGWWEEDGAAAILLLPRSHRGTGGSVFGMLRRVARGSHGRKKKPVAAACV